jgi:hypothetical protein
VPLRHRVHQLGVYEPLLSRDSFGLNEYGETSPSGCLVLVCAPEWWHQEPIGRQNPTDCDDASVAAAAGDDC